MQTPEVLFAYWQLSGLKERLIEKHFGKPWRELSPALRLCIEAAEQDNADLLELPLPDGESCFLTGFPARAFVSADLGIYNAEGQFLPLLRSNRLELPAATGSSHAAAQHTEKERPTVLHRPQPISLAEGRPLGSQHFSAYSLYYPTHPQQI